MSHKEEPELKVSPAAAEAMAKLVELFSDPSLASKAQFRCCVDGPTEFEVLFESIVDEQFVASVYRFHRAMPRLWLLLHEARIKPAKIRFFQPKDKLSFC